jgi:RNA polymerase sigma factor (sigma-70 family)
MSKMLADSAVIEKILNGETELFEILIRRYNSFLYKVGRSYNFNHDDTQDLMQDTFVQAYRNLSQFAGRSTFKTWIIRIMINTCNKRKEKFSYKYESAGEINERSAPMFSNQSDAHKTILNRELNSVIENALRQIPEDYRIVFTLREISGLSVKETAESLALSESNVKVRLNRAKGMLRKEVEKSYTAEEIFEFNLVYCDAMVERVMGIIRTVV